MYMYICTYVYMYMYMYMAQDFGSRDHPRLSPIPTDTPPAIELLSLATFPTSSDL